MTILSFMPVLLRGVVVTLEVTAASGAVAFVLAVIIGTARLSPVALIRNVATAYVEIFRGTSALIQLYYLYFILPVLGIEITPMSAAALGLGLTFSAYGAEIVRSAISTVDRGQWDAALALGMTRTLAFRRIIGPQALVRMLAPGGNLLVELLKSTSLVSLITLTDLTFAGTQVITSIGKPGQTWGTVLLLYFLMCFPLAQAIRRLEKRLSIYRA
jgi:polar amino acid transport system permease protein